MFTVDEVAEKLGVSKVTIYAKLKKFEDKVAIVQGKKGITDELFNLIKDDLKVKGIDNEPPNKDNNSNARNDDISMGEDELSSLNKELINALLKQLEEKDKQIAELHKLIENNQVLLKQEKEVNQLQLQEHFKELDVKLNDVREKMDQRKEQDEKKGFFKRRAKK